MNDWKGLRGRISSAGGLLSSARNLYLELTMIIVRVLMDYFQLHFLAFAHVHLLGTPPLPGC
jgi:hypothetical protein